MRPKKSDIDEVDSSKTIYNIGITLIILGVSTLILFFIDSCVLRIDESRAFIFTILADFLYIISGILILIGASVGNIAQRDPWDEARIRIITGIIIGFIAYALLIITSLYCIQYYNYQLSFQIKYYFVEFGFNSIECFMNSIYFQIIYIFLGITGFVLGTLTILNMNKGRILDSDEYD